jgi:cardiolipin synthase A/B
VPNIITEAPGAPARSARSLLCFTFMKLIVQPEDGLAPLLTAIGQARKSVEMMIFRFDRPELEGALAAAVARGVAVRTLIAHTNSEGERALRKLELRLLAAGALVARTADDLVRYHAKYIVIDRERLLLLGFNYTTLDLRSRSFGLDLRTRKVVQEVGRLFDADVARQPWAPALDEVVVSPLNARDRLAAFIQSARSQLLVYDPKLSDPRMIRLLNERLRAGVDVRAIGHVSKAGQTLPSVRYAGKRLHVRAMIADGERAFVGSQSLRKLELDRRRELGLVVRERAIVAQLHATFEMDWSAATGDREEEPAKRAEVGARV